MRKNYLKKIPSIIRTVIFLALFVLLFLGLVSKVKNINYKQNFQDKQDDFVIIADLILRYKEEFYGIDSYKESGKISIWESYNNVFYLEAGYNNEVKIKMTDTEYKALNSIKSFFENEDEENAGYSAIWLTKGSVEFADSVAEQDDYYHCIVYLFAGEKFDASQHLPQEEQSVKYKALSLDSNWYGLFPK